MKKLLISKPSIIELGGKTRLVADVKCNDWKKQLWYEVDNEFAEGLCDDNVDAFLLAILPFCMVNSTDDDLVIIESESRISKQLSLQLRTMYIPIVAKFTNNFNKVEIHIDTYENTAPVGNAVIAGISGGVDSFYSLLRYTQDDCEEKITHGICANMGIYDGFDGQHQTRLHNIAMDVSKEMGLPLIYVKSNIMKEVYKKQMATNVSFVYMSMGLALQNMVKIYYFSSDVDAEKFNFNSINAEEYDLFNVHMFSNGRVRFYSSGSEMTRMEKIRYISDYSITYDKIDVCPYPVDGCQCHKCEKCTETMCALDVLGKLDKYNKIYDIDRYKREYAYHWGYILLQPATMPNLKEILDEYKKVYGRFKFSAKKACVMKYISRGFKRTNENKRIEMKDLIDRI